MSFPSLTLIHHLILLRPPSHALSTPRCRRVPSLLRQPLHAHPCSTATMRPLLHQSSHADGLTAAQHGLLLAGMSCLGRTAGMQDGIPYHAMAAPSCLAVSCPGVPFLAMPVPCHATPFGFPVVLDPKTDRMYAHVLNLSWSKHWLDANTSTNYGLTHVRICHGHKPTTCTWRG